jgi:cyanate permease
MLVVGRFVVGVGIGVSAVVVPAYLGEVSPRSCLGLPGLYHASAEHCCC